jgi:hypothetical protein
MESFSYRYRLRIWALALGICALGVFFVLFFVPVGLVMEWKQFTKRYIFSSEYVRVENQPLGNIIVARVKLKKPGYVELVLSDGMVHAPGENGIGYSRYLPSGEFMDIPIEVDMESYNNMPFTRVARGAKMFVIVHTDNGDQEVNPDFDPVARDNLGDPVLTWFTIL